MSRRTPFWAIVLTLGITCSCTGSAKAETVALYAAGSLRAVIVALQPKAAAMGVDLVPTYGGSGELRDRIDQGATPDLFLSADMASPRKLAEEGRAVEPAIAFARNHLCLVARRSLGLTPDTLVQGLLASGVRIKTSKPIADPSGDYAMAMFDRINAVYPGAGAQLRGKAEAQMSVSVPTQSSQNMATALFAAGLIDVAVTYCSASDELAKSVPALVNIAVPAEFDPQPLFGMALLSASPAAKRFMLFLLSDTGQAAIAAVGLIPLASRSTLTNVR